LTNFEKLSVMDRAHSARR